VGLVVAVWFFWKSLAAGQLGQAAIAEPSRPGPNPPQIVQKSSPPAVPAPAVVAAPAPAPAPDPDAWLTNLTLKAIFYSKTNPRALVNGTMVETGDKIDGVLITGILSDRIFVDWNGQTRELKMGRQ